MGDCNRRVGRYGVAELSFNRTNDPTKNSLEARANPATSDTCRQGGDGCIHFQFKRE